MRLTLLRHGAGLTALVLCGAMVCASTAQGAASVTANDATGARAAAPVWLFVSMENFAGGRVTSSPAGIDCGGHVGVQCSSEFAGPVDVTLVAAPAPLHQLPTWRVDGVVVCPQARTCSVHLGSESVSVSVDIPRLPVTLQVMLAGRGSVTAAVQDPSSGATLTDRCESPSTASIEACQFSFPLGQVVDLYVAGVGGTRFVGWSEAGCGVDAHCRIAMPSAPQIQPADPRLDALDVTLTATFSPVTVAVQIRGGPGTVTSPAGVCAAAIDLSATYCNAMGEFEVGSTVTFQAAGADIRWNRDWCDDGQPARAPTCALQVSAPAWVFVGFGEPPSSVSGEGPEVYVRFGVRKAGTGRGNVEAAVRPLLCGTRCTADYGFGTREVLTATAEAGSRFVRWEGACSTDPTCRLAVGPTTSVRAVFDLLEGPTTPVTPVGGSGSTVVRPPTASGVTTRRRFAARVVTVRVQGRGAARKVLVRVKLNTAARGRAALRLGRRLWVDRRVVVRRTGVRPIVIPIPRRAPRGAYRLRLALRAPNGQAVVLRRTVRLPR